MIPLISGSTLPRLALRIAQRGICGGKLVKNAHFTNADPRIKLDVEKLMKLDRLPMPYDSKVIVEVLAKTPQQVSRLLDSIFKGMK